MKQECTARLPVSEEQILDIEIWLEQMALQGWFFTEPVGKWWYCSKGEPARVRYRLDMITEKDGCLDEKKRECCEAEGWHFTASYKNLYHIFRAEDPSVPELHINPQSAALVLKQYEKTARDSFIGKFTTLLLCAWLLFKEKGIWLSYPALTLADGSGLVFLAAAAIVSAAAVRQLAIHRRIREICGRMRSGEAFIPTEDQVKNNRYRRWNIYLNFILIVLFAVTLLQSCQNGGPVQQQLNDGEVFPALELIEDGKVQDSPENEGEMFYRSNLVLRQGYHMAQTAPVETAEHEMKLSSITADFYDARWSFFSEWLFSECRRQAEKEENAVYESLSAEGFDTLLYGKTEKGQNVLAKRGTKILKLSYEGDTDLSKKWDLLRDIMDGKLEESFAPSAD